LEKNLAETPRVDAAALPDSGLPDLSIVELSQAGESIRAMRGWSFWEIRFCAFHSLRKPCPETEALSAQWGNWSSLGLRFWTTG